MGRASAIFLAASALLLFANCECGGGGAFDGGEDASGGGTGAGGGGGGGTVEPDAGEDAGLDAGASRTVTVTQAEIFHTDDGGLSMPRSLSAAGIALLVPTDGGFRTVAGVVAADGGLSFPDVPAGPYYLKVGRTFVHSAEPEVDLSFATCGRPDVAFTDGGATLFLNLSGLSPWAVGDDELQLAAPNAGFVGFSVESFARTAIDAGQTSHAFELDWAAIHAYAWGEGTPAPLVDATAGDRAFVTQLVGTTSPTPDGGSHYARAVKRAAPLPPFTVAERGTVFVTASVDAGPLAPFVYDLRRSQFQALRAQVHPSAFSFATELYLSPVPYTSDEGIYSAVPDVAYVAPWHDGTDHSGSVTYFNPYPQTWPLVGSFAFWFYARPSYPDGGLSYGVSATMRYDDLAPSFAAAPVTPKVGPPRDLRVNGSPATTSLVLPTPEVTLSWSAPSIGSANGYRVHVFRMARPSVRELQATLLTTGTSVAIPPDVLRPGNFYLFRVRAEWSPGVEPARAPFRGKLPYASAEAMTGIVAIR